MCVSVSVSVCECVCVCACVCEEPTPLDALIGAFGEEVGVEDSALYMRRYAM